MTVLAVILGVTVVAELLLILLMAGRTEDWRQALIEARRENEELKEALFELEPGRKRAK